MTLKQYTLEGTSGTAVTTANSGLAGISIAGSSSVQYQSGAAYQGSTGARFTSDGTNTAFANAAFTAANSVAVSLAFKIPASLPSSTVTFAAISDASNGRILALSYSNAGVLSVVNKNSASTTLLTAAQATASTWFRIEMVVPTISSSTGSYTVRAYTAAGAQAGTTVSQTNQNTGTAQAAAFQFGLSPALASYPLDMDSVQTNDGATSEIGPIGGSTTNVGYSGSGSLTAIGVPNGTAAVTYSGAGTLTTSGTSSVIVSAVYSGAGSLAAAGGAAVNVSAAYSGAGTLTASGTPSAATAVAYSGLGSLSVIGKPGGVATAAYSGSGVLTVSTSYQMAKVRYGAKIVHAAWYGTRRVHRIGYGTALRPV